MPRSLVAALTSLSLLLTLPACELIDHVGDTIGIRQPVVITPATATLAPGQSQVFTVDGIDGAALSWASEWGTITGSGNTVSYTAPSGMAGTLTLTVTQAGSSPRSGTAEIVVSDDFAEELIMHPNGRVARLRWPAFEYVDFGYPYFRAPPMTDLTRVVFRYFHDDFDFIFFAFNVDVNYILCTYHSVRNDVLGIGLDLYDRQDDFGSSGRLRGVLELKADGLGPTHGTMGNAWANYYVDGGNPRGWGFSSANGQMGGFDRATLTELGDGLFRASSTHADGTSRGFFGSFLNGGNSPQYSPIELYLMGLLPPEGVPPILVARDPEWADQSSSTFRSSGFDEYSIDDLIALHGPRQPSHLTSQKEFRVLTIVVTDRPLTETAWRSLDVQVERLSHPGPAGGVNNFWQATGGRSTLKMDDLFDALKGD